MTPNLPLRLLLGIAASLLICSQAAASRPVGYPVAAYTLSAKGCPGGAREGTGFVVKSEELGRFLSLRQTYWMVTALHVVHQCTEVRITERMCEPGSPGRQSRGSFSSGHKVVAIPELDLALIPLDESTETFRTVFAPHAGELTERLDINPGDRLAIGGVGENHFCPFGEGRAEGRPIRAIDAFPSVQVEPDEQDMFGSVPGATLFIIYESTSEAGTSGGPITKWNSRTVLGFHEGGAGYDGSRWGPLLSPSIIRQATRKATSFGRSSRNEWPPFKGPVRDYNLHSGSTTERVHVLHVSAEGGVIMDFDTDRPGLYGRGVLSIPLRATGQYDPFLLLAVGGARVSSSRHWITYETASGTIESDRFTGVGIAATGGVQALWHYRSPVAFGADCSAFLGLLRADKKDWNDSQPWHGGIELGLAALVGLQSVRLTLRAFVAPSPVWRPTYESEGLRLTRHREERWSAPVGLSLGARY